MLQKSAFYQTPEALQEKIDEYVEECKPHYVKDDEGNIQTDRRGNPIDTSKKASIAGLAYFLGFESRQSFYDYGKKGQEFAYVIARARLFVESGYSDLLVDPSIRPQGPMFALKQMGWKDGVGNEEDERRTLEKLDEVLSGINKSME